MAFDAGAHSWKTTEALPPHVHPAPGGTWAFIPPGHGQHQQQARPPLTQQPVSVLYESSAQDVGETKDQVREGRRSKRIGTLENVSRAVGGGGGIAIDEHSTL